MGRAHATINDLAPVHALMGDDFPELLREAGEALYLELAENATQDSGWLAKQRSEDERHQRQKELARLALAQVARLTELFGGTQPYWPSGKYFVMSERNLQICAEFRGDYTLLARKYNLSEIMVRNIVDGWQRKKFMQRQGKLPGLDEG